jgi:hypothetical protein
MRLERTELLFYLPYKSYSLSSDSAYQSLMITAVAYCLTCAGNSTR